LGLVAGDLGVVGDEGLEAVEGAGEGVWTDLEFSQIMDVCFGSYWREVVCEKGAFRCSQNCVVTILSGYSG
jgi:hypothetical protein